MAFEFSDLTDRISKLIGQSRREPDFGKIRCPKCEWRPSSASRWFCANWPEPENFFGGCGTTWNTFETRGKCPGCSHQWKWTSCLSCEKWSLHGDWYEPTES